MKLNRVGKNGLNGDKIHIVPLEIGDKLEILQKLETRGNFGEEITGS